MNIRIAVGLILLAAGLSGPPALAQATGNEPNAAPPAASSTATQSETASGHHSPKRPPLRTTPPAAGQQTGVRPNTYTGAQGKKSAPGTACSSARLKTDGSPDCGMSGKAAAPPHPK